MGRGTFRGAGGDNNLKINFKWTNLNKYTNSSTRQQKHQTKAKVVSCRKNGPPLIM
jgi:hypothetical protein